MRRTLLLILLAGLGLALTVSCGKKEEKAPDETDEFQMQLDSSADTASEARPA